jgi:endonuclease YncB( thermonuclease family)
VAFIRHQALTAATVATIGPVAGNASAVEVVNRSGTAEVFVTVDGSTPTVGGNDCEIIPAVAGASTVIRRAVVADMTVRMISSGTPTITVRAAG